MGQIHSYHRFYALLSRLGGVDREELKSALVLSHTDGRTSSLREMTDEEYEGLCLALEERTGWRELMRKKRSLCLKLMQQAGVDTTDWGRVNDFCRHPKIAGKAFGQLSPEELDRLGVKLRAIMRKGGLRRAPPEEAGPASRHPGRAVTYVAMTLEGRGEA